MKQTDSSLRLVVEMQSPGALLLKLSNDISENSNALSIGVVRDALDRSAEVRLLSFESSRVTVWDSRFVAFIRKCVELCKNGMLNSAKTASPKACVASCDWLRPFPSARIRVLKSQNPSPPNPR